MDRLDPHSYFDADQPRARHLRLALEVDFARRMLEGSVTLELAAPSSGRLDLDTKALSIRGVRGKSAAGQTLAVLFQLDAEEPVLGQRLRLILPDGTAEVTIDYATSPEAVGLQWLEPAQTEGKKHPYLFSQCQAIHARTVVPVQDSPRARITYSAAITVPQPLSAVMSAGPAGTRPGAAPDTTTFLFEMPQAIPPYLIAIAVGELASRDLSPRSRVWAEPATVDKAAWEFAGIGHMLERAESLFGPYEWDRYDMLVLPPSFPYGGMENPRMTFLTPTLLAGDRSLVDVVAHELAHSWTGNLITNATADHFWLNEGWTVWAERRIQEALHGPEEAAKSWAIGQKALDAELERFGKDSPLTKLRNDLRGPPLVDPDDAFSSIPYEKGARLLALLERAAGRERWDVFVRDYLDRFRFTSITTEEFMAFLEEKLPGLATSVNADEWLHQPGLPASSPQFRSARLEALTALASGFAGGTRPSDAELAALTPNEILIYLQNLPRPLPAADCAWLDSHLQLTGRGNHEILVEWLCIAVASDVDSVFPRVREVLTRVGRMKYLRPLYKALGATPRTRALAASIFAEAKDGYHNLSRRVIESVIAKYPS